MNPEDLRQISLFSPTSAFTAAAPTVASVPTPPVLSHSEQLSKVASLIESAILSIETEDPEIALLELDDALREVRRHA